MSSDQKRFPIRMFRAVVDAQEFDVKSGSYDLDYLVELAQEKPANDGMEGLLTSSAAAGEASSDDVEEWPLNLAGAAPRGWVVMGKRLLLRLYWGRN